MTIEEMRLQQEEIEKKEEEHKKWRKEKSWFISLPRDPFYDGEIGDVIQGISDLSEVLEDFKNNTDKESCTVKVKFMYRTNGWKEDLPELD